MKEAMRGGNWANSNPELIDYKLIEDGNNFSSSFIWLKLLALSATLNNRLINDNLMLASLS